MNLRDFFNGILLLIGGTSLTDAEYATMSGVAGYTQANYDQLATVLLSRDAVSNTVERLTAYFKARGFDVTAAKVGSSNILIGGVLC